MGVTNDNVKIYYSVQGKGKPLLFVPGWSCRYHFFDKNMPVLAEKHMVIGIDFRGHGEAGKPEHGYRIARFAKDVQELLEHLDAQDVTAVGCQWVLRCCGRTWNCLLALYPRLFPYRPLA